MFNQHMRKGTSLVLAFLLAAQIPSFAQEQLPQSAQPASQPPTFQTGVASSGYLMGPGDRLKIGVFEYEEFAGEQVILPDGTISMPLVGTVVASERTPDGLALELTERLKPFLKNPIVSVGLSTLRPLRINVAGEVLRPGPLQLTNIIGSPTAQLTPVVATAGGAPPRTPTVSAALAEAGGVTKDADIRRITLKRFSPDGSAPTMEINLWDAVWSQDAPRDIALRDGDTLYIPKLAPSDTLDRKKIATSSLASRTVRVRVVGEVKKPGEVEVLSNGVVSSAIATAGGPTDKADLGQVLLTRLNSEGQIEKATVNVNDLVDQNQIQQGDVIVVPKSGTSFALDFALALFSPFTGLARLYTVFDR